MTELDTIGDLCPIPIIKIGKTIKELQPGDRLVLLSDDPGIEVDLPAWCASNKHQLLSIEKQGDIYRCVVQKKPDQS